jgi:hypothetical protein
MLYIDPLALHYYRKGHDPLDWGIGVAKWQTMKHDHDRGLPRDEEAAGITARQIIVALLDAGWSPPTLEN